MLLTVNRPELKGSKDRVHSLLVERPSSGMLLTVNRPELKGSKDRVHSLKAVPSSVRFFQVFDLS